MNNINFKDVIRGNQYFVFGIDIEREGFVSEMNMGLFFKKLLGLVRRLFQLWLKKINRISLF